MQVYIGIDWSESKHDVVAMNAAGAVLAQLTIPHSIEGFLIFKRNWVCTRRTV